MLRNRLKDELLARGMTPIDLCRRTGLSPNTVYPLVRDETKWPGVNAGQKICFYLGCKWAEIFYEV